MKFLIFSLSVFITVSNISCTKNKQKTLHKEKTSKQQNSDLIISSDVKIKQIRRFMAQKKFAKAILELNKYITKDPHNAKLYHLKGVALFNLKKINQALENFNKSFSEKGDFKDLYVDTAETLFFLKKYDKCKTLIKKGLQKYPHSAGLLYNLGGLELAQGNTDKAIKAYSDAILANPKYAPALLSLGELYYKTGKKTDALDMFSKLTTIKGFEANGYLRKGYIHMSNGNFNKAEKCFNKGLSYDFQNKMLWFFKIKLMIKQNKTNELIKDLEKTIETHPNNMEIKQQLVSVLIRYTSTVNNINKALNIINKMNKKSSSIYFLQAAALLKLKKCSESYKIISEFKQKFPSDNLLKKIENLYSSVCK